MGRDRARYAHGSRTCQRLDKLIFPSPLRRVSEFAVRVLQYRSVAFVTYVSEFAAQFAKEAMACQSLDNDEILNVRWATEDPNPVQKVAEKRRLVEIGQEAIRARMDPRIVDAMRSVRALEDGVQLDDENMFIEDGDDTNGEPEGKRRRLEGPDEQEEEREEHISPPESVQEEPKGLLSSDTLEGLQYFAEIRRRQGASTPSALTKHKAQTPAPALGLGDYGSDEEED